MDSLPDIEYSSLGQLSCLVLFTFLLGRLSVRSKSQNTFSKSITELNYRVLKCSEDTHFYASYQYKLKVYCCVLLIFSLLLSFILYYPFANYEMPRFEIISFSFIVSFCTYLASMYSSYKSKELLHSQLFYTKKLSTIRAEIVRELGPEVVDALKSDECSKKCTDEIKKLNETIMKYKAFIERLAKFQWCDGCSHQKKCGGNCGPDFWIYVRDALRGLKP